MDPLKLLPQESLPVVRLFGRISTNTAFFSALQIYQHPVTSTSISPTHYVPRQPLFTVSFSDTSSKVYWSLERECFWSHCLSKAFGPIAQSPGNDANTVRSDITHVPPRTPWHFGMSITLVFLGISTFQIPSLI